MTIHQTQQWNKRPQRYTRGGGFTMIEMLITMVVLIALVAIAIPQYTSTVNSQATLGEIRSLQNDIEYARSEAMKEGQNVTICASSNSTASAPTCSGSWQQGWIIYANTAASISTGYSSSDSLLRVQGALTTSDTISTKPTQSYITFNRNGFASGLTTSGILFSDVASISGTQHCLWVDIIGHEYLLNSGTTASDSNSTSPTC